MRLFMGWLVGALTGIVVAATLVLIFQIEDRIMVLLIGVMCSLAFSWAGIDIAGNFDR